MKMLQSRNLSKLLIVSVMFTASTTLNAVNFYVSTSGNDTQSGSLNAPFRTIVKAASMVAAGDTVLIAAGTYTEQNIVPKASGTERKRIVFKPLTASDVVIVKHPGTTISDNTPVFQLSNRNYIWIEGLQFKDFQYGRACVYISGGTGNVVVNNRFENLGNSEIGTWDGNSVVALFNSTENVVTNNYFKNIFGDGVNVNSQKSTYNLVSNNAFYDFKGKLRSWGGTYLYSRAIDVQDMSNGFNLIAFNYGENLSNFIWLDRDGSNNVILRNYGKTGAGTVFNESRCAYNTIQENISVNMSAGFMSAYYDGTGWTLEARWVNNVAYNNQVGFNIHKSIRDEFRNNIAFNNTSYNLKYTAEALSNAPQVFQNNLWFTQSKTNSVEFKGKGVPVSEFQLGVREKNGMTTNPLFTSVVSGAEDFTLQSGSAAKQAGDNGLDLGAYAQYPKTAFGNIANYQPSGTLIYFDRAFVSIAKNSSAQLTLRLSKPHSVPVKVALNCVAGDAVKGVDFSLSTDTVVFEAGVESKTVTFQTLGEADFDELLALRLSPVGQTVSGPRDLMVIQLKKTPKLRAFAGLNQTVWEEGHTGFAPVKLDASLSISPLAALSSASWTLNNELIGTGLIADTQLPVGNHSVQVEVSDVAGNKSTDNVYVTVQGKNGIWLEAEWGAVGSQWNVVVDSTASNNKYVTIQAGVESKTSAPTLASGLLQYTFDVLESGTYSLILRTICPNSNDDSFWIQMDGGTSAQWNGVPNSSSWQWNTYPTTFALTKGRHQLVLGHREDGAKLDKLWLTNNPLTMSDAGPVADNNPTTDLETTTKTGFELYPNPVRNTVIVSVQGACGRLEILDLNGRSLMKLPIEQQRMQVDCTNLPNGIYVVKVTDKNQVQSVKKMIVKK